MIMIMQQLSLGSQSTRDLEVILVMIMMAAMMTMTIFSIKVGEESRTTAVRIPINSNPGDHGRHLGRKAL